MSVRVMARIWDDFPGDGPELLAMLAMGDMANDEGHCWPSMATIAKKIRRSRSQAQRVLHSLIGQGFIVVIDNLNGGAPGTTRRYRIVTERLTGRKDAPPPEDTKTTTAGCKTGRTHATGSVDATPTGSTHATGSTGATGRIGAQDGSHGCDGRGRTDATQTIIETSGTVIPSASASPAPEPKPPKRATQLPPEFYPNETGVRYAEEHRVNLATELQSFRNHHLAKGTTFKDWQAAWRTWCDKAVEFGRAGSKGGGPSPQLRNVHKHAGAARAIFEGVFDD